jgi:hypothetical protein
MRPEQFSWAGSEWVKRQPPVRCADRCMLSSSDRRSSPERLACTLTAISVEAFDMRICSAAELGRDYLGRPMAMIRIGFPIGIRCEFALPRRQSHFDHTEPHWICVGKVYSPIAARTRTLH